MFLVQVGLLTALLAGCGSSPSRAPDAASSGTGGTGGAPAAGGTIGSGGTAEAGGVRGSGGGSGGAGGAGGTVGGGAGGLSGAGGTSTSTAPTPTEVCRKSIEVQCARLILWEGGTTLRKEIYLQDCLHRADYCPDYYFAPDSNRTVENVGACLDALATRSLSDVSLGIYPSCLLSGKRGDRAACMWSSQCQSGQCGGGFGECSTCSAQPGAGEQCPALGTCRTGAFCNRNTYLCADPGTVAYASEGEPCNLSASAIIGCRGDLRCVSKSSGGGAVCTAPPGIGEPCGGGAYPGTGFCGAGADCTGDTGGTCAAPGLCGQVTACDAASFCQSGGSSPVCAPRVAAGQPCYDSSTAVYVGCLPPATCNITTGLCAAPRGLGESCDDSHACGLSLLCSDATCQPQSSVKCPA
jgi:hypothetical protein